MSLTPSSVITCQHRINEFTIRVWCGWMLSQSVSSSSSLSCWSSCHPSRSELNPSKLEQDNPLHVTYSTVQTGTRFKLNVTCLKMESWLQNHIWLHRPILVCINELWTSFVDNYALSYICDKYLTVHWNSPYSVLPRFSKGQGQGAIWKGHFSAVKGPSKGHFSAVNWRKRA